MHGICWQYFDVKPTVNCGKKNVLRKKKSCHIVPANLSWDIKFLNINQNILKSPFYKYIDILWCTMVYLQRKIDKWKQKKQAKTVNS